uniref:Uncharacterized protein n=1 Tax=Setaria italica TaxID=4555 RepID=K3ZEG1_SETIT
MNSQKGKMGRNRSLQVCIYVDSLIQRARRL